MTNGYKYIRNRTTLPRILLLTLFVLLIAFSHYLSAQESTFFLHKVDPRLISLVSPALQKNAVSSMPYKWMLSDGTLRCIIDYHPHPDMQALQRLGCTVTDHGNGIATARIPLGRFAEVISHSSVSYIHSIKRHYPLLDSARSVTGIQFLHDLTPSHTGENTLIGIYDSGIDWQHPDFVFIENNTLKSRILYLWDQTLTTGNPPSGYTYGFEYTQDDFNTALAAGSSPFQTSDPSGHGTAVASAAAGNHRSGSLYSGAAPGANLIIVKGGDESFTSDKEIEGIEYILEKADALGLPVVVNLSFGGHSGAHDGTSPLERYLQSQAKNGTIFVAAAGNDGEKPIHFADTLLHALETKNIDIQLQEFEAQSEQGDDIIEFDIWHSGSSSVSVTITTPNGFQLPAIQSGSRLNPQITSSGTVEISNAVNGINEHNNDKQIYIKISDQGAELQPGTWTITFSEVSGQTPLIIHGWMYNATMNEGSTLKAQLTTASADYNNLVSIPGTTTDIITVGAFVSKESWTSIDGQSYSSVGAEYGSIAEFSSAGPNRTGVIKPDVSAPGEVTITAKASDSTPDNVFITPDSQHTVTRGTSFAAPITAGTIALLLAQDPGLNTNQVRQLLSEHSTSDSHTGSVPNTLWGYGKLNAFNMVNSYLTDIGESQQVSSLPQTYVLNQNYPNPFNPSTAITFFLPAREQVILHIHDILGRQIITLLAEEITHGWHTITWKGQSASGQPVSSGIYFYTLRTADFQQTKKMLLLR